MPNKIKTCFCSMCAVMAAIVSLRVYLHSKAQGMTATVTHSASKQANHIARSSRGKPPSMRNNRRGELVHTQSGRGELLQCCRKEMGHRKKKKKKGHGKKKTTACQTMELRTLPEFYASRGCLHGFRDDVAFFLVGKAGAGTILTEIRRQRWNVATNHPRPKSSLVRELQQKVTTLVINVRDPVERFVSAFRWRLAVLCHPGDERYDPDRHRNKGAANNPQERCKTSEKRRAEEHVLRETYRADPGVLAEALCEGPGRAQAAEDYTRIGHSLTLSGWLEFLLEPPLRNQVAERGVRRVLALPMERRGDGATGFEEHLRQLLLHLLQTRYSAATAAEIMTQVQPAPPGGDKKKEKFEHSSAKFHAATNSTVPATLSPLGECCLVRHLRQDYRLIRTMLGEEAGEVPALADAHPAVREACAWGDAAQQDLCRSDLRSMLSRRARYLDPSRGPCTEVI